MPGRLINWNIERRGPQTWQAASLLSEISENNPDIVFLTEGHVHSLRKLGGYSIDHRGYRSDHKGETERLVVLWSREPWEAIAIDETLSRKGGIVAGVTRVNGEVVTCIGICIPYHMAKLADEASTQPWLHHILFIAELAKFLRELTVRSQRPIIVAGDFNRRLPSKWGNKQALADLEACFSPFAIETRGPIAPSGQMTIDHVAMRRAKALQVRLLDRRDTAGRARSDHDGVVVDFSV